MDAMALALSRHTDRNSSRWVFYWNALLTYWTAMSMREKVKRLWDRVDLTPREKFEAFLEGYLMSFDLYPVCDKHLFARKDAYALMRDFWEISADVNRGTQALIKGDERDSDDIRRRRVEAARRALEAIQCTRIKRSSERP